MIQQLSLLLCCWIAELEMRDIFMRPLTWVVRVSGQGGDRERAGRWGRVRSLITRKYGERGAFGRDGQVAAVAAKNTIRPTST